MATIAVLYGSVREHRRGIRVATFITKQLEARDHTVTLVDPLEYPLPFLNKRYKEYEGDAPEPMERLHKIFENADGFIVVSAEYNHSIPPVLKNMFDHFHPEFKHKPAGIVSYSNGPFGGARVAPQLRILLGAMGLVSIPPMFPISNVSDAIKEDGVATDESYDRRVQKFLDEFEWYVNALRTARTVTQ